jgi:glycerol uptake facilitator-like aquaporin
MHFGLRVSASSCGRADKRLTAACGLSSGSSCCQLPAGGHLNPAITMGCLCTKKVTAQRAVCYWAAQVAFMRALPVNAMARHPANMLPQ